MCGGGLTGAAEATTPASDKGSAEPALTRPRGPRCGRRAETGDDLDRHRTEHALHAGPHMVDGDRLGSVIPQEPCYPGMMGTLGPLIVERSPDGGELQR